METATIKVDGMMCEHCVKAVSGAVHDLTESVAVDLTGGAVTVTFNPEKVSLDWVKAAIEEQGYDVG